MNVLLAGYTGLTGGHLLRILLATPGITKIFTWGRRPAEISSDKIIHLGMPQSIDTHLPPVDLAFCTLGTTIRKAGSKEAFKMVDVRLVQEFAEISKSSGVQSFVLQSSVGAGNPRGNFYLLCKQEAEQACIAKGFKSLNIVRPSILGGKRTEFRLGERIGLMIMALFRPFIPRRFRIIEAEHVALAMLHLGMNQAPGVCIIESEALESLANCPS